MRLHSSEGRQSLSLKTIIPAFLTPYMFMAFFLGSYYVENLSYYGKDVRVLIQPLLRFGLGVSFLCIVILLFSKSVTLTKVYGSIWVCTVFGFSYFSQGTFSIPVRLGPISILYGGIFTFFGLVCVYVLSRACLKKRRYSERASRGFQVLSFCCLATLLVRALFVLMPQTTKSFTGSSLANVWEAQRKKSSIQPAKPADTVSSRVHPNIVYLVVDAYARSDVLQELYQFDNSSFENALADRGFWVAPDSFSNYSQTMLSIASTVNLNYFDNLLDHHARSRNITPYMIENSYLFEALGDLGYSILRHKSGYAMLDTEINKDLQWMQSERASQDTAQNRARTLTQFRSNLLYEDLFFRIGPMLGVEPRFRKRFLHHENVDPYLSHRKRVLHVIDSLDDVDKTSSSPFFLYAHVVSPHPPFVLHQPENASYPNSKYLLSDGSDWGIGLTPQERASAYRSGYTQQLSTLNKSLLKAIDACMMRYADHPLILILQADHGPGLELDWKHLQNTNFRERHSILLAVYSYGHPSQSTPYRHLRSPVNLFRTLLSQEFEFALPSLEDKAFYSTWDDPFEFHPVSPELLENSTPHP